MPASIPIGRSAHKGKQKYIGQKLPREMTRVTVKNGLAGWLSRGLAEDEEDANSSLFVPSLGRGPFETRDKY